MRICVVNGSPKGEMSVSLQYARFIAKRFPGHEFAELSAAQQVGAFTRDPDKLARAIAAMAEADAILFAQPVYYMLASGQLVRFFELLAEAGARQRLAGKPAAVLMTSIHFFDHLSLAAMRGAVEDLGLAYVDSFSADMEDLMRLKERERLLTFAGEFLAAAQARPALPRSTRPLPESPMPVLEFQAPPVSTGSAGTNAVIVIDRAGQGDNLTAMAERLAGSLGPHCEIVDLSRCEIKGGCLGCIECGLDNRCAYLGKDECIGIYERLFDAGILVFAAHASGRFFSSTMKNFIDRGFFRNHAPMFAGKQMAWLVGGPLSALPHLDEMMRAYAEMHHAGLCGVVTDESGDAPSIGLALDHLAARLASRAASGYAAPQTFLGIGGRKLFRDDIYGRLRFVFQADHRQYKRLGFYDFPQKDVKTRLINALMMTLSRIPGFKGQLRKMIKPKMVEQHRKIVDKA